MLKMLIAQTLRVRGMKVRIYKKHFMEMIVFLLELVYLLYIFKG